MKNLIIFSHTHFENSRVNKALLKAAQDKAEVRNLEALYEKGKKEFDIKLEQDFLVKAEHIIFQFPLFWLNCPPLLKSYMDTIFLPDLLESRALVGKNFSLAISTGSPKQNYQKDGANGYTIEEITYNFRAMCLYIGFNFKSIFHSDGSLAMSDERLNDFCKAYQNFLD
ncbi:flavodoxin family protein [Campylobacter sp. MIT 12-5580]|uniref:NAD(P)H-dependent oxidoreductase n=1 Tax=Campylobacter sp. MIT 12-5580 TaxID=2040651 RepID=UPI0010F9938B|nr:NAD(P)H-dependent oxidoreductase [Campylobacter sp. MIT 12-5580]TKX28136.1 flavodoxin family protein [Campylobacter sp. MIT 12-5580]